MGMLVRDAGIGALNAGLDTRWAALLAGMGLGRPSRREVLFGSLMGRKLAMRPETTLGLLDHDAGLDNERQPDAGVSGRRMVQRSIRLLFRESRCKGLRES